MADAVRRVSLRLKVEDGAAAEQALTQFGEKGQASLRRIEEAGKPASKELLAVNEAGKLLKDQAEQLAGPLGRISDMLGKVGPAGLAAAAALGAGVTAFTASARAAGEWERQMFRVDAVLKATGGSAGVTAKEIDALAVRLGRDTLASAAGVREAAAAVAAFDAVSGPAFTRTIELAQDLAAVFGRDLQGEAVRLAKSLADPVKGLDALRESGLSFTEAQKKQITVLVESGDKLKAQGVILDALAAKVGGAGVGEAKGLAGQVDTLSENWTRLMENVGRSGPLQATTGLMERLAAAVGYLADRSDPVVKAAANDARGMADAIRDENARSPFARQSAGMFWDNRSRGIVQGMTFGLPPGWAPTAPANDGPAPLSQAEIDKRTDAALKRALALPMSGIGVAGGQGAAAMAAWQKEQTDAQLALLKGNTGIGFGAAAGQGAENYAKFAEQQRERNAQLDAMIEKLEREQELLGLSDVEREKRVKLLDAERTAQRGVTVEERARIEAAVEAASAVRTRLDAEKKAAEETKRIWDRAAEGIQDSLSDTFRSALDGNLQSSRDFWASFKNFAFDTIAQVASALVFKPVAGNLINALSGGAAGSPSAGGGFGGITNLLGGASSVSNLFGVSPLKGIAGALGLSGGALSAGAATSFMATPAFAAAALNGSAGAAGITATAAGAGAGLFGGGGALGLGALGGPLIAGGVILGGLALGKLFGGKTKVPRGSSLIDGRGGRFAVTATGATGGGDTFASDAQTVVDYLNGVLDAYGGRATGGPGTGIPGASIGAEGGQIFTITGRGRTSHASLEEAATKAIVDLLAVSAQFPEGVNPSQEAAAGTLDQAIAARTTVSQGGNIAGALSAAARGFGTVSSLSAGISGTLQDLNGGGLSPLSPAAQLAEQRGLFARTLSAARGGDASAISSLGGSARSFLESSRAYNASSSAYAQDFALVTRGLEEVGGQLDQAAEANRWLTQIASGLGPDGVNAKLLTEAVMALEKLNADGKAVAIEEGKSTRMLLEDLIREIRRTTEMPGLRAV